jgi:hypothetical protein
MNTFCLIRVTLASGGLERQDTPCLQITRRPRSKHVANRRATTMGFESERVLRVNVRVLVMCQWR